MIFDRGIEERCSPVAVCDIGVYVVVLQKDTQDLLVAFLGGYVHARQPAFHIALSGMTGDLERVTFTLGHKCDAGGV